MPTRQNGNMAAGYSKGNDDSINFREIFNNYSRYWPLFLASVAIALTLAFIYSKFQKPIYTSVASLEMQDSKDKPTEEKSALHELDLFDAPKVVENEIQILKSRQLVKDVVNHLRLWTNYKVKRILNQRDLYGASPVKINFVNADDLGQNQSLDVQILNKKTYQVTFKGQKPSKHNFGEVVTDSLGTWAISSTPYLRFYMGKVIQVDINNPESTIQGYQKALNVDLQDKLASIVQITVMDQNPKRGEDFINTLIYYYNQAEVAQKNNITKATLSFIDKRLDSLKGELNYAENKVAGYRSGTGITDVNAQSQMYLQDAQANSGKLNDVNVQLNVINGLEQYVNSGGDRDVPSTMGLSDPGLVTLIQSLANLQLKKTELLGTLPPGNPQFEPLNKQIANVKAAIKENISNIKSNLLATKASLQSVKSNVQSSIQSLPVQQKQIVGLSRQQSVKETLYNYLLQKREEISLRYASSLSDPRMVDVAYTMPLSSSKKYTPFAIALLLGLILPAGYLYGQEVIKNSINKRKDIEDATTIPVVAEFNYIKLPSEIVLNNRNNTLNYILIEQFRHLRTQLNFLNQLSQTGNVTMITSSMANEGKSFISTNLGISLAKSEKKTILLEMDIYKPKVSAMFNLKNKKGLSDYLRGKANKDTIINAVADYPNLEVISCGEFVDDFSELLAQTQFSELINELKLQYDHVLIDTPPIRSINDAYIIAKYCDVTLYVVRYNHTSKNLLPFIQKLYSENKLPGMNIVFNGLREGRDGEGYKYERYEYNRLQS
jgi:tyrosine-protein kinase Etk/Wzc